MTWDQPPTTAGRYYGHWPPSAHAASGEGPTRVVTGEVDPTFKPRPVGFAPPGRHRAAVPVDSLSRVSPGLLLVGGQRRSRLLAAGRHRREVERG